MRLYAGCLLADDGESIAGGAAHCNTSAAFWWTRKRARWRIYNWWNWETEVTSTIKLNYLSEERKTTVKKNVLFIEQLMESIFFHKYVECVGITVYGCDVLYYYTIARYSVCEWHAILCNKKKEMLRRSFIKLCNCHVCL